MPPRSRTSTDTLALGNRDPKMEQMLRDQFNVDFAFMSGISVSQIDVKRSRNLNTRTEPINEPTKAKYIAALERDDKFPPVVLYKASGGKATKYSVADGVHRIAAHEALGFPVDAYVIDPSTPASTIVMIAYACNTKNGLPNTFEECVSHAIYFVDNGMRNKDAAALVGIKSSQLTFALNVREADNRAKEAGINVRKWEALGPSKRASLNRITTNPILKKAAMLAHDANLTSGAVNKLVVQLGKTKEPDKQSKWLDDERRLLRDDIDATAGGLTSAKGAHTDKGRWALVRSQSLKLPDNPKIVSDLYKGDERIEAAEDFGLLGRRFLAFEKELLDA
jgi:hypothetical protein